MTIDAITKRSRGNPGKAGTLEKLLLKAFDGLEPGILEALSSNIEKNIFSGSNSADVYRNYKVGDIRIVEEIYGFLQEDKDQANDQKDVSKDPPAAQPAFAAVDSVSARLATSVFDSESPATPPPPPTH